jgi:hypothetical protein
LVNSRLGLLYATSRQPLLLIIARRPHFSRSYVCFLPSSLTLVLSSALDFSSHLPVSDYGTVAHEHNLEIISWHHDYARFAFPWIGSLSRLVSRGGFAYPNQRLTASTGTTVLRPGFTLCVIPSNSRAVLEYEPVSHRLRFSASP